MPPLGSKIHPFKFTTTRPGWIDPHETVGFRLVYAGRGTGLKVLWTASHDHNKRRVGELIYRIGKERGVEWHISPLTQFSRAASHIELSNTAGIERGENQVATFLSASAEMKRWGEQTPTSLGFVTSQLGAVGGRLMRAHTSRRLQAAARVTDYDDFIDSLGRPNPLISDGQFRVCARLIGEQVGIDTGALEAIARRTEQAAQLWQDVVDDVEAVLDYLIIVDPYIEHPEELYRLLERLQIKPFKHAVSYIVWALSNPGSVIPDGPRLGKALIAEYMLAGVDFALSEIKADAKKFETVPLFGRELPVPVPASGLFETALPLLGFDEPYAKLSDQLLGIYQDLVLAGHERKFDEVQKQAQQAQNLLRYRGSLGHAWRQPLILEGRTVAA